MKNQHNKPTLSELADILCDRINSRANCFQTIHIVFPNLNLQQWFKAYWLNTQGDAVLLNVSFETMSSILPLITEDKYKLISANNLRQIIINILSNDLVTIDQKYKDYYKDSSVKLYDFADSLTKLYLDYFADNFEGIKDWNKDTNFERAIYDKVIEICDANKFGTIKKPVPRTSFKGEIIYFFGFGKLERVYRILLDSILANDSIEEFSLIENSKYELEDCEIIAAPSILREVENLHSKICELLKDKNNRAIDFLVVSPNLSDYVTSIERVFKQDDETFPSVPYVINYQQKKDTDVVSALKILYRSCKNRFYTRLDFYDLITNPIIRTIRNISDEDIDAWTNAIISLKVHREHGDIDEWDYLKKRLLLSKVSSVNFTKDNLVVLKDGEYLPYSSINLDDDSIIKIVDIINDINDFRLFFESRSKITVDDIFIQEIKEKLDKWFKTEDIKNKSFSEYRKIISVLDNLRAINAENIDGDVFFGMLFDGGSISSTQIGSPFFDGISFIDYDINSIVTAKYVFLLGASSNNMPRPIIKSELDQRLSDKQNDDELIFNLLKQNSQEFIYISYVDQNLKTDEKFFLTPIVDSFLKSETRFSAKAIRKISIDETRYYSDLYTRKEFNDREYYKQLFSKSSHKSQPQTGVAKTATSVLPASTDSREVVTVSQMKAFLEEPLSYRATHLFNKEDNFDEEIIDEYEPLNLDILSEIGLSTGIVLAKYNGKYDSDEMFRVLKLSHLLPQVNDKYEKSVFERLEKKADLIIEMINDITGGGIGEVIPPREARIPGRKGWTLKASQTYYRYISHVGERFYIAFRKDKEKEPSKFLTLYVLSLMDLAKVPGEDDSLYKIILALGPKDSKAKENYAKRYQYEYEITKAGAIKVLNEIHDLMDDFTSNVAVPVDLAADSIEEYYDLTNGIFGENGVWKYFDQKNLFDKDNIGYDADNFEPNTFIDELNKQIRLIKYLKEKEKAVNNNGQP